MKTETENFLSFISALLLQYGHGNGIKGQSVYLCVELRPPQCEGLSVYLCVELRVCIPVC